VKKTKDKKPRIDDNKKGKEEVEGNVEDEMIEDD
jgi:hypothetical protein